MRNKNIASLLREKHKERYLASIFIDKKYRHFIQSLFLFDAEISAISHMVKEAQLGEIRLSYWQEILEGKRMEESKKNPIAKAILLVLRKYNLPPDALIGLLQARRFDLYSDKMANMNNFEIYANKTVSTIYRLGIIIMNEGKELANNRVAEYLGIAEALIGHVRAFAYNRNRGRLFLPQNIFIAAGVDVEQIFTTKNLTQIETALKEIINLASDYSQKAKMEIAKLPANIRSLFILLAILDRQISIIKMAHPNSHSNSIARANNMKDWQKLWLMSKWMLKNSM